MKNPTTPPEEVNPATSPEKVKKIISRHIAIAYYETARNEMFLRIREREHVAYVWLAALGTILTVAFHSSPPHYEILMLLPIFAIGISMRLAQHEDLVKKLATYCKSAIGPKLREIAGDDCIQWDVWIAAHGQQMIVGIRNILNAILIVAPCLVGQYLNWPNEKTNILYTCAWWTGWVLTLGSIIFLLLSLLSRMMGAREPNV